MAFWFEFDDIDAEKIAWAPDLGWERLGMAVTSGLDRVFPQSGFVRIATRLSNRSNGAVRR